MIGEEPELAVDQLDELQSECARTEALPAASAPETNEASLDRPALVVPAIEDVHDLDWQSGTPCPDPLIDRGCATVEGFEVVLDQAGGPGLLFDGDRADAHDQAIQVGEVDPTAPLWIIGDLHGDVLALEAALALIGRWSDDAMTSPPNIVLLGDLFDDDGLGLELLLRVFDLILASRAGSALSSATMTKRFRTTAAALPRASRREILPSF